MREEKHEENAQIGRFHTNLTFDNGLTPLPFFSRLFFIFRALLLAVRFLRGRVRRAISVTSNQNALSEIYKGLYYADLCCIFAIRCRCIGLRLQFIRV